MKLAENVAYEKIEISLDDRYGMCHYLIVLLICKRKGIVLKLEQSLGNKCDTPSLPICPFSTSFKYKASHSIIVDRSLKTLHTFFHFLPLKSYTLMRGNFSDAKCVPQKKFKVACNKV